MSYGISIHALREEGDHNLRQKRLLGYDISIHALREEGDQRIDMLQDTSQKISIHALREEGDGLPSHTFSLSFVFLSTPSARRATLRYFVAGEYGEHFYPRPPRGGRPWRCFYFSHEVSISIHALREEGDYTRYNTTDTLQVFLSTPSARRATAKTERKPSAFVSLYTSLHKLQRGACKTNRKITPLLAQTAGIPVRSVRENHVCCRFALAGHQKISTLSCANSGCSPTCSTLVW